jgi:hypothetical protein
MTRILTQEECRRMADQHWEMAGLARTDNDRADEIKHIRLAKYYEARKVETQ